jgi:carboxylesterase
MQKWEKQVRVQMEKLSGKFQNTIIVAHSMGTLFAIDMALAYPQLVRQLFLLAVPLKPRPTWRALIQALQVNFNRPDTGNAPLIAAKAAYSIAPDWRLWRYPTWAPRYLELLRKISETRKKLPLLSVPCCAVQSKNAELVSPKAFELLRRQPQIEAHFLQHSSHGYYAPTDKTFLLDLFTSKCQTVK